VLACRGDGFAYTRPYCSAQEKCENFKKTELAIRYGVTGMSLPELNRDYDAFLCGSDQIWSVFEQNFNPYYYLSFVDKAKIAYAPCLGTDKLPETVTVRIKELLSGFSAISVRERISAEQLSILSGKNVEWVCDPTLLFDSSFWGSFSKPLLSPRPPYLLCYFLENNEWYYEAARHLAKKLHLKIKLIANKWDFLSSENVIRDPVGPKEFVGLFQNAAFVLTDSYHGSIFSLIFEKDFFCMKRFSDADPRSQNIRVDSLFTCLSIMNRLISEDTPFPPDLKIQDYAGIRSKLNAYRERSQSFLAQNLQGLQEELRSSNADEKKELTP
jgi:hypothetical protein